MNTGISAYSPTVVPAECMWKFKPLAFNTRCTSATSLETLAVGVPSGIRQKSAVQWSGVGSEPG